MLDSRLWFDDCQAGPDFVILCRGDARVVLRPLTSAMIARFASAKPGADFSDLPDRALVALRKAGLSDAESGRGKARRRPFRLVLVRSSVACRVSTKLCQIGFPPRLPLGFAMGLVALATTVGVLLVGGSQVPAKPGLDTLVVAVVILIFSVVVHELGHASACYRVSGVAGGFSLVIGFGRLSVRADVTALELASPNDVTQTYLAGAAAQLLFVGAVTMILAIIAKDAWLAGLVIVPSVLFALKSLVPYHLSDGAMALCHLGPADHPLGRLLQSVREVAIPVIVIIDLGLVIWLGWVTSFFWAN